MRATMAEAKAAWDNFAGPKKSVRAVVKAMNAAGLEIAVSTFQHWKKADWIGVNMTERRRAEGVKQQAKRPAVTSAKLERRTGEHERKITRVEVIAAEEADMKVQRDALLDSSFSDAELSRTAIRESLVAQIILARQITRRAAVLVEVAPETAAKLLAVLKAAPESVLVPAKDAPPTASNGDDARVVDGKVINKSDSQLAIEAFRNRRAKEAA